MTTYKIDPNRLNKYMLRTSFKPGLYSALGAFLFIGGVTMWSLGFTDFMKLIGPLIFLSAIVGGIVFLTVFIKRSIPKATIYTLGTDSIGMKIDKNRLNAFNEFVLNRSSRKYGFSQEVNLPFSEIKSIVQQKSSLDIMSAEYNSRSGDGKIIIPCELENYLSLVEALKIISENHSNISFSNS